MARLKVFIRYDNGKGYRNMLLAWDKNDNFDFSVAIQSTCLSGTGKGN